MKFKLKQILVAIGLAVLTTAASAVPVIFSPITGFQDDNLDVLVTDVNANRRLDLGDQLLAVVEIAQTFSVVPAGTQSPIIGGELTGVAAIEVVAKLSGGVPVLTCTVLAPCTYVFAPVSQGLNALLTSVGVPKVLPGGGAGGGAMSAFWFDTAPNLDLVAVNCVSITDCVTRATDGALYQVDGRTADLDFLWIATGVADDNVDTIKAGSSTSTFGTFNFSLSTIFFQPLLGHPTPGLQPCAPFCGVGGDGLINMIGSGTVNGGQGLTNGFDTRSDFDFQKASIPEPDTLALLAVALLGLGVVSLRRRQ